MLCVDATSPGIGAWMVRGYAIGLGAGTQVVTLLVGEVTLGPPDAMACGWLMGNAWVFNAAIAEWIARRSRRGSDGRPPPAPAPLRREIGEA